MIRRIVFAQADYDTLRAHVLQGREEQAAVCLGGHVATPHTVGILVREVHPVPESALVTNSGAFVEIDVEWLAALIKRARTQGLSVVVVHSHPFAHENVRFSGIDTAGHAQLLPRLQARVPDVPHAEIVFGQSSAHALLWPPRHGTAQDVDALRVIGPSVVDVAAGATDGHASPPSGRKTTGRHASSARQASADLPTCVPGSSAPAATVRPWSPSSSTSAWAPSSPSTRNASKRRTATGSSTPGRPTTT